MTNNEQKLVVEILRYGDIIFSDEWTTMKGKRMRRYTVKYSGVTYDIEMTNGEFTYLKEQK